MMDSGNHINPERRKWANGAEPQIRAVFLDLFRKLRLTGRKTATNIYGYNTYANESDGPRVEKRQRRAADPLLD